MNHYHLLGKSGLRVSPLALGTMTFGEDWGWGAPKTTVFQILDRYLEKGGNFLDTADGYTNGSSEKLIGEYFAERGGREKAVIATKFSLGSTPGDPNSGGNGRKNIYRALEGSLKRLRTDFVDLYWLHAWDGMTPVEEVMETFADLRREGKIRYAGLSDVPAWYFARAQSLGHVIALQLEYSLLERNIEREHIPAAHALGASIVPWSPLASGMLSGKYSRDLKGSEGRLPAVTSMGNPGFSKLLTERNWSIVDLLKKLSAELGKSPAQVALNWVSRRPGVGSTIIGASKIEQLENNLSSLDFELPAAANAKLEEASRPELVHPYHFFETDFMRAMHTGGTAVRATFP